MTTTYTPIASQTLTSAAASVTFSSIPQTYRDIVVVVNGANTGTANTNIVMRFNSDSTGHYSNLRMFADRFGVFSQQSTTGTGISLGTGNTSGVGVAVAHIMDYSATDKHKTTLNRENPIIITFVTARTYRWPNTDAVTTISFTPAAGQLAAGTTFSLYGIVA